MAEIYMNVIVGVLLLFCGVQDFLNKKIYIWVIGLGAVLVGIGLLFDNTISIPDRIWGVAIGTLILVISKITGGKIGMGDGFLLCVTGLGLGFWSNLELFGVALFFAALVSIVLLIFRIADRKKSIPFVPFLLMGYLFLIIANKGNGL